MFLGTFPMSMLTLISGTVAITQAYDMGEGWVWAMSYWYVRYHLQASFRSLKRLQLVVEFGSGGFLCGPRSIYRFHGSPDTSGN